MASRIPPLVAKKIERYAPQINMEDFCYCTPPFFGFDSNPHRGEMVVHASLVDEVCDIFEELFAAQFPIEKMRLIEEYGADDNASMADNNTSAFCYRLAVAKPGILSKHALGRAIDINPLYNPYVRKELILPPEGKLFIDRSQSVKGMIHEGSICHTAFTKRGWIWGGTWPDRQDYQHFEKNT